MAKKAAKKAAKGARNAAKKAASAPEGKAAKAATAEDTRSAAAKKARKAEKKPAATPARKAAKKVVKAAAPKAAPPVAPPPTAPDAEAPQRGAIRPAARKPAVASSSLSGLARRAPVKLPRPSVTMTEVAARELPQEYGETRVSVLVRDPEWLFVFWEIASGARASHGLHPGGEASPLVLRLHDQSPGGRVTDIPVNDLTSSWYVRVPVAGAAYVVELGIKRASGEWVSLARSGAVQLPRAAMAEHFAPGWSQVLPEVHRQLVQLSGGFDLGSHLGSEEFSLAMQRRLMEEASSFSGMLFSGGLVSSEFMAAMGGPEALGIDAGRGFWLTVGVDVIVYGATDPGAAVTLMGRPIKLTPEGSFRVRMAFPDGKIEFPVEATSPDGVETRRVCPVVQRETT